MKLKLGHKKPTTKKAKRIVRIFNEQAKIAAAQLK